MNTIIIVRFAVIFFLNCIAKVSVFFELAKELLRKIAIYIHSK